MKILFKLIIAILLLSSCKKEGLSKDTGNVEVTVPKDGDYYTFWTYETFTEEQYIRYTSALSYFILRHGSSDKGKIYETGLFKGNYVLRARREPGAGIFLKYFQITPKNVTKLTLP